MSFNLANEPDYWHSGKDPFSRPLWTEYLKTRHGSIDHSQQYLWDHLRRL